MKIWWHSQNLNVKEDDHYKVIWRGPMWKNGRAWLHFGEPTKTCIHGEWLFGKKATFTMLELELGGGDSGDEIMIKVGIPRVFALFLGIEGRWLRPIIPGKLVKSSLRPGEMFFMPIPREIGINYFGGYLRLNLWNNPNEWSSSDPKWWSISINIPDLFLGRSKHADKDIETGQTVISLPEKDYPAKYRFYETTWKRPRWPRAACITRVEIEPDEGLPIPGKGENSYDLDDDAIESGTYAAATVAEGVEKMRQSVLKRRKRYGGDNWVPG